jgi:tumor protein p53-inducible protein 3
VHYKDNDGWAEQLMKQVDNKGYDVLLDSVFASQFKNSLEILGLDSTWVVYSLQTGSKLENIDLAALLRKRITITGSTLKSRSSDYKTDLIKGFSEEVLPHFNTDKLKLKIDSVSQMDWSKNDATPFI